QVYILQGQNACSTPQLPLRARGLNFIGYFVGLVLSSADDPVECVAAETYIGRGVTMGLKDVEGKRSGRPRGAKTSSRVKRDIMWAYRNLANPDAKPPSAGAMLWANLARQQPGHFLACLVQLETPGGQDLASAGKCEGAGREPDRAGASALVCADDD